MIRAISTFNLEEGKSTRGCFAREALRIRVSMSATGSVVIRPSLPAGLHDTGDFALQRQASKTDAAHLKFAEHAARPAANPATVALADLVFQLLMRLRDLTRTRHASRLSLTLNPRYGRNGTPSSFNNSRPSSSVRAVVVMVMFMPLILSTRV